MINIEKGVPIPDLAKDTFKPTKGSLKGMTEEMRYLNIGDSFLWSDQRLHAQATNIGIKIVTRREGDQFRIWRSE